MNTTKKNVVLCANPEKGHYFDGDSYSKCPYCGFDRISVMVVSDDASKGKKQKGIMSKLFGNEKKHDKEPKSRLRTSSIPEPEEEPEKPIHTPTVKIKDEELFAVSDVPVDTDKKYDAGPKGDVTYDLYSGTQTGYSDFSDEPEKDSDVTDDNDDTDNKKDKKTPSEYDSVSDPVQEKDEPEEKKDDTDSNAGGGLIDVIKKASASAEGKTMSYFDSAKPDSEKEKRSNIDPVVGWLVCIEGDHFGESFNISAGMNSIGRNNSNRIVFNLDKSVSREKHAFITYEPKKRRFFIKPGDSSGLTYVNDEYVTESVLLKAMDIIELGNSKFILIPLCGENFSWENYISKE